ncbi:flavohemoglobin expression-modulating QEGLA motif protein [Alteromonas sp. a30]|uniref:flavohemoglobin expression-modulating QEGLA motif protein n=1 Tax=Alteromonas sp. a30 TaxID=2730917 RepID=UPI002281B2EC|nr:flavohemoglobin expression-modulating QEGLA motif protein [Alteromonas sp. a30]MCY7296641.1 flavohemoglobin expression-modulating QEGLA motif protein [Alteromonas sp. a30]
MQKVSEQVLLDKIANQDVFQLTLEDGSLTLKVEAYAPVICTAVHAGHQFTEKAAAHCLLSEDERLYEEDPHTDQFVQSMPITLVCHDSRYRYDLNRPIATCIYKRAWGKQVWRSALPSREKQSSIAKHQCFYRILDALISSIEKRYGACLVYDVHSYNYKRHDRELPVFNLGVEQVDMDRWGKVIRHLQRGLNKIDVPNNNIKAKCNDIFYGRGYMIAHVNSRFQNTLVVPTEIKKIYMDELSGEPYQHIINDLSLGIKESFTDTAAYFSRGYTRKIRAKKTDMLSDVVDPALLKVDKALFKIAKDLETLRFINPTNIRQEKRRFFANNGDYQPQFLYRPLNIDTYLFRENIYRLPVDEINDPGIQKMYRDVIDSLATKIDMLANAGQPEFLYDSLKYYGEPTLEDERHAQFLLHAAEFETNEDVSMLDTNALVTMLEVQAKAMGMQCKVETSANLAAKAMVSNSKKTVYVGKQISVTDWEARGLVEHELGVHMATTLNANLQTLKVFSVGLPGNTFTQEGLALLSEYLSGNLRLSRLKDLALRVVAVKEMLNHGSFKHTYNVLAEEYKMPQSNAFKLAVRVHRGGGFTKDHLYLKGFTTAVETYKNQDLTGLFIGKTGFKYLPLINELMQRNLIASPTFLPRFMSTPTRPPEILAYLVNTVSRTESKQVAI